jgi:hypothetical protein
LVPAASRFHSNKGYFSRILSGKRKRMMTLHLADATPAGGA